MAVTTIGNIDVKVNVAEIKTAVLELNNLAKVAGATQTALDRLSGVKLDNIRVSVTGARGDIAGLSGAVQLATNRLQQMASTNLGALSSQAQTLTNALNQASKAGSAVGQGLTSGAGAGASALNAMGGAAGNAFNSVNGLAGLLSAGLKFTGIATVITGLTDVGVAAYNSYQPIQSLTMGLEAMGQNGAMAVNQMRQSAQNLGLDFMSTTKSSLQWQAAINGTVLEGAKGQEVFDTFSATIKLFGGGTEEVNGAMRALTQMMSKGTVQSEELKGQLGERLPGAFRLMAESLGMTTAELTKALKDGMVDSGYAIEQLTKLLKEQYGDGVKAASSTTQSELNRMKNDWGNFASNVGKDIDDVIGDIARLINKIGVLKTANVGATLRSIARDAEVNGETSDEHAKKVRAQYAQVVAAAAQKGVKLPEMPAAGGINWSNPNKGRMSESETLANFIESNKDNKPFMAAMKVTMDYQSNRKESEKSHEDKVKSAEDEKKEFVSNASKARRMASAVRRGDKNEELAIRIEELQQKQVDAAKSMTGAKLEAFKADIEVQIAGLEAQKIKLAVKAGKANAADDKKAQTAAERALTERDTLVNRSTTYSAQLTEQRLRLQDGEGMSGEIARTNRQYDDLIQRLEKVGNLSAENLKSGKEEIEKQRAAALEEIENIKKVKDEKEAAKEIDQQRLQIQRDITAETRSGNTFLRQFDARVSASGSFVDKFINDYKSGNVVKSKYARDKDTFVNQGLAKNDQDELEITQKIAEQKYKIVEAEQELAKFKSQDDPLYKERLAVVEQLKGQLKVYGIRREAVALSRASQRNSLTEAFDQSYNDKRTVSYGVVSGAQEYMDSIKGKSEKAAEQVIKFGGALTNVFMAKNWGEAKNSMKGYFAQLLTSIQETIVQLLIVKPIIDRIQTAFEAGHKAEKSGGGLWGMVSSVVTNLITGGMGGGATPTGGSGGVNYSLSGSGVRLGGYQANGGAWHNGAQLFANGGVVNRATAFGMAGGGIGVMGEAGAEVIAPLKRNSRGQMGVMVNGGVGGNQISNNLSINIAGNASADTIEQIKSELLPLMNDLARNQANNAVARSNRPGGMNYGR